VSKSKNPSYYLERFDLDRLDRLEVEHGAPTAGAMSISQVDAWHGATETKQADIFRPLLMDRPDRRPHWVQSSGVGITVRVWGVETKTSPAGRFPLSDPPDRFIPLNRPPRELQPLQWQGQGDFIPSGDLADVNAPYSLNLTGTPSIRYTPLLTVEVEPGSGWAAEGEASSYRRAGVGLLER
jgi:hypothetical protein